MSWATTFWDLEYIVDSTRRAMEACYFAEDKTAFAASIIDTPGVEGQVANPVEMLEPALTTDTPGKPACDPLGDLAASMKKQSLADKPTQPVSAAKQSSPWTSEIEAALRAFLKPLSMNVRYDYQFSDMLDEKTSIATMNRLFKQPARPDDGDTRDISLRDEIRRKCSYELRRSSFKLKDAGGQLPK